MMVRDSRTVLTNLWTSNGINLPSSILKNVKLNLPAGETHKNEQSLKSSFRIGVAAQVSISATSLASCFLHELRKEIKSMHLERASMSENGKKKEVTRNEVEVENDLQDLIIGCSKRIPTITVSERHSSLEFASEKFTRVVKSDTFLNYNPDPSEMEAASIHFLDSKARSLIGISEDAVGDWDSVAGIYETKPKGELRQFVRLHTNFPHHKRGLLRILNLLKTPQESETKEKCSKPTEEEKVITREMIQEKLKEWNALDFETEVREKGFCATMMRTEKEWEDSQMGKEVRKLVEEWEGPVLVEKIEETQDVRATSDRGSGDDAIVTRSSQEISCRNLENGFGGQFDRSLRILDLSRVIAGPVAGRALAAQGASVLLLSAPHNPHLPLFEIDTARGKQAAYLDLDQDGIEGQLSGQEKFKELIQDGDVLLQAYRPSGLSSRGISPESIQKIRPGMIFASLSAYGPQGPWSQNRGFDSLTQCASGMNHSESLSFEAFQRGVEVEELRDDGEVEIQPRPMPVQALDHSAGYLLSFGILAAKIQQSLSELKELLRDPSILPNLTTSSKTGYKVTLSLATSATWLKDLGRVNGFEAWGKPKDIEPQGEEVRQLLRSTKMRGEDGVVLFGLKHAAEIEGRSVGWEESPNGLGGDELIW